MKDLKGLTFPVRIERPDDSKAVSLHPRERPATVVRTDVQSREYLQISRNHDHYAANLIIISVDAAVFSIFDRSRDIFLCIEININTEKSGFSAIRQSHLDAMLALIVDQGDDVIDQFFSVEACLTGIRQAIA